MEKSKLTQAKINLYHALLEKIPEDLTNREVDLGFILSGDPDIQNVLGDTITRLAKEKLFCIFESKIKLNDEIEFREWAYTKIEELEEIRVNLDKQILQQLEIIRRHEVLIGYKIGKEEIK